MSDVQRFIATLPADRGDYDVYCQPPHFTKEEIEAAPGMFIRFFWKIEEWVDRLREWWKPRTVMVDYFRCERPLDGPLVRCEIRWKRKYGEWQTDRYTMLWENFDGTIWRWRRFSIVVEKSLLACGTLLVNDFSECFECPGGVMIHV